MRTYRNGEAARYGLYLSAWLPDLRFVSADDEPLEGIERASYMRLPTPLVVLLGPVIGGLFVLLFPLVVFAAVAYGVGTLAVRKGRKVLGSKDHLPEAVEVDATQGPQS
jgi:hypothetical protein